VKINPKGCVVMNDPTSDSMSASISCGKCGSNELLVPEDTADDSIVVCSSCGHELGRWGDIQAAVLKSAEEKVAEDFKDGLRKMLKGVDGVKFE
jgi:hypothetical protein